MNEYLIYNEASGIERPIFGYTFRDACRRSGVDPSEWTLLMVIYEGA